MEEQAQDWLRYLDQFSLPPNRIVSLVPSVTESLFALNFGEKVVGVTDYCVHPGQKVAALPKVGGTKNPQLDQILALKPALVIANREENTQAVVAELSEAGVPVWVTFPKTVDESIALLRELAGLFHSQLALQQVEMLEIGLEWAEAAAVDLEPLAYFCPIWQESGEAGQPKWMTFNRTTYCHDLLERLGGRNIFQDQDRQVPLAADHPSEAPDLQVKNHGQIGQDIRYPRVSPAEVIAGQPELILLPDEPFPFSEAHLNDLNQVLADTPAVRNQRVRLFDGSMLTWHGTRLAQALQTLPLLLAI